MEQNEKLTLYKQAKEKYYNGEPIMGDAEFDALEKELGLENKSYVGTRHNPSYTNKHPFIMGSLSKVQIKEDENGVIDWTTYYAAANKFFGFNKTICTPKFDGCSWEYFYNDTVTITSRGDGEYGKDLTKHLCNKFNENIINSAINIAKKYNSTKFTLRGEALVNRNTFAEKYEDKFVNTRSFVAGVLNKDYDSKDIDFINKVNDIAIVIYDFRIMENDNTWIDLDWTTLYAECTDCADKFPKYYNIYNVIDLNTFKTNIYNGFNNYREVCEYSLDGIVIKPVAESRINNITETRPSDCVAIKFVPMLTETEVTNIVWQLGKTGEMIPVINFKPIELDGKIITKCSGHNYGTLIKKQISVGTKIIVRLAGDIIPDLYRVTDTSKYSISGIEIPDNCIIDGVHLMAVLDENTRNKNAFIASSTSLNIPSIGPKIAEQIYEYVTKDNGETDEFFGENKTYVDNILLVNSEDDIYYGAGGGKTGTNAKKAIKETIEKITLTDIIDSCNFRFCGKKIAEQVSNYLLDMPYSFEHFAAEGYNWIYDANSEEYCKVIKIMNALGRNIDDFKQRKVEISNTVNEKQIPIIMTGEPNDYATKSEFLKCHPEYRQTTSWKEVQIVFTNDIDSNTGKMKKARDKNIEIRLY